jgi:hypothetical protein
MAASLMLGVLMLSIGVTQSRTALLFGPVVAIVLYLHARRAGQLRVGALAAVALAAVQVAVMWAWPVVQRHLELSPPESLSSRGVGSVRFQVWPMLMEAVAEHPWEGFGWLQVGAAELSVADHHAPVGELWLHGHNLFIELLVWCGCAVGMILIALVVFWYASRVRRTRSAEAVTGMLTVTILLIHSLFELPHHYAYFLIPCGLWIGLIEWDMKPGESSRFPWNLVPLALAAALLVGVWRDYPAVEEDFRLMRFENLSIGTPRAKQAAPDAPFLSSLTAFLRFARTKPVAGMTSAEIDAMRAVVERYPYSGAMIRFASALALNGRLNEAQDTFRRLRTIHGERVYQQLRGVLRRQVEDGELGLRDLERSLPL